MTLEICKDANLFRIKGRLDRSSLQLFQETFDNIFEKMDQVVISIEDLQGIDREGVVAIAKLHNEAIIKQKKLSIVGIGCKELYQHFNSNDAA